MIPRLNIDGLRDGERSSTPQLHSPLMTSNTNDPPRSPRGSKQSYSNGNNNNNNNVFSLASSGGGLGSHDNSSLLARRAADVAHTLNFNVLACSDVGTLQRKLVEVGEIMQQMERWYDSQLTSRAELFRDKLMNLNNYNVQAEVHDMPSRVVALSRGSQRTLSPAYTTPKNDSERDHHHHRHQSGAGAANKAARLRPSPSSNNNNAVSRSGTPVRSSSHNNHNKRRPLNEIINDILDRNRTAATRNVSSLTARQPDTAANSPPQTRRREFNTIHSSNIIHSNTPPGCNLHVPLSGSGTNTPTRRRAQSSSINNNNSHTTKVNVGSSSVPSSSQKTYGKAARKENNNNNTSSSSVGGGSSRASPRSLDGRHSASCDRGDRAAQHNSHLGTVRRGSDVQPQPASSRHIVGRVS